MSKVLHPNRVGEPSGEPAELVLDMIGSDERERVAEYLASAQGLIAGGYWTDPVTDDPMHQIPYTLATDGNWVWGRPWAYFVSRYGAALPAEFLEHIRALDYQPPAVSKERAREIRISEGAVPPDSFRAEFEARKAEKDSAETD